MANELSLALVVPAEMSPAGIAVRMAGTQENPLFCLTDLCRVLEVENAHNVAKRVEEDDRYLVTVVDGLGKNQEMWFVTEAGLYTVLLRSDKPQAKPFRKWVCGEVLPCIRKHGYYPAPVNVTEADPILGQLHALVAVRERQLEQERRLEKVEVAVAELVETREEAQRQLEHVERSSQPAPDLTLRARINELVRLYCLQTGTKYEAAWGKLYKELYYRCSINARARAKNSGCSMIEEVEKAGLMVDFYSIASELLR